MTSKLTSSSSLYSLATFLLSLCLGFSIGWFIGDNRLAEAFQRISSIVFVLLTTTAAWQLTSISY